MIENLSVLERAANLTRSKSQPLASVVVEALLQAEKTAKRQKIHYSFDQLIGNWRLCFITGTKKTRQKAGIVLGAGRYVPQFIKIQLAYSVAPLTESGPTIETSQIENMVEIGGLKLILTGPIKFLPHKNILVFDFTRVTVQLFGATLYRGYIRGGESKERIFSTESVAKQAFFVYFLIQDGFIAARGRGGGLALWSR